MGNNHRATSILEFLTTKNPTIVHLKPKSKTNTHDWQYHFPAQLRKWESFKFELLKEIEGGKLFEAACKDVELPHYPTLSSKNDTTVKDESSTRKLIEKWNETMVTSALECVQYEFNPAVWLRGETDESKEYPLPVEQGIERMMPPRRSSARGRERSKTTRKKLYPDSGAVSANSTLSNTDPSYEAQCDERFPKEYKVGTKWYSAEFFARGMVDAQGKWTPGAKNKNYAMPIGQAYSYCLDRLCRYGCILTCYEAFIFRITPQDPETNSTLTRGLTENGLMEWISIPWSNHGDGQLDSHGSWTINLVLWFMHILVGKNYKVDWHYKELKFEELALQPQLIADPAAPQNEAHAEPREEPDTDATSVISSDATEVVASPRMLKRKRGIDEVSGEKADEEPGDNFEHSFSKRRSFTANLAQLVQ